MLWFKRNVAPIPPEQPVAAEDQALPSENKIERLVDRLGVVDGSSNETLPGESKIDQLVDRPEPVVSRIDERMAASSPMRVIVVASQKGGNGKTTVAAHLAVHASIVGQGPVVLIDTDPQGSLSEWWAARKDEYHPNDDALALATTKLNDLPARLAELRKNRTAFVVIDTPPAITTSIAEAISIADLVVIPTRPSPHDLRAIGATMRLTRMTGKPFLFVVNGAVPRAKITAEAVTALSAHGQVAPVILSLRTDYAASMIDGRTVMEAGGSTGRSAQEIAELWNQVCAQTSMRAAA